MSFDKSLQSTAEHRSQAAHINYNCTRPRTPPALSLRWRRPSTYTSKYTITFDPSTVLGLISQIWHILSYGSVRWMDHQKGDWWVKSLMPVVNTATLRYDHWSRWIYHYQSLVSTCLHHQLMMHMSFVWWCNKRKRAGSIRDRTGDLLCVRQKS
jgi:hypothetical protein